MRSAVRSYAPEIVEIASRRASAFGVVSLGQLAAALEQGLDVSEVEARKAVVRSGAEFLDDDWFWLPRAARNRLLEVTNRILAVAAPLDVATLRAGVWRTYARRQAALVPPSETMAAFYRVHPCLRVDALGRVRPAAELDYRTELGKTDRIFVEVLRASWTGVLDRTSLRNACVAYGMTTRTFNLRATFSAVLDNPAADIWCLRGTRVSPITAAALRHAKALEDE
jgi:hypothetical protein